MPLTRWNESVFRFMFSRAVTELDPTVEQFFECGRIDLVLRRPGGCAFVEFKFYIHSPRYDPATERTIGFKGGPSKKNRGEFEHSVELLRERAPYRSLKLVALFYSDPATGRKYDTYYGYGSRVAPKLRMRQLVSIGPFSSADSGGICNARLYEVRA